MLVPKGGGVDTPTPAAPSGPGRRRCLCQAAPPHPAQGASLRGVGCAGLSPAPHGLTPCCLVEQSQRAVGRWVQWGGFLGVRRAGCHPPLARTLSQGLHGCSQQRMSDECSCWLSVLGGGRPAGERNV